MSTSEFVIALPSWVDSLERTDTFLETDTGWYGLPSRARRCWYAYVFEPSGDLRPDSELVP